MSQNPTSVRFTDEDRAILARLMAHNGVKLLPVLQLAIRCLAREQGILPKQQDEQSKGREK